MSAQHTLSHLISTLPAKPGARHPRRPGRPDTAGQIWKHCGMLHALVKLYLYTNISTDDISKIITSLARQHVGEKVSSGKRSTQEVLRRLLAGDDGQLYHRKLRPQSRDAARARVALLRAARDRRAQKARIRRRSALKASEHEAQTSSIRSSSSPSLRRISIAKAYFDSYHSMDDIEILGAVQQSDIMSTNQAIEGPKEGVVIANSGLSPKDSPGHKHVRLSWVRKVIADTSGLRPSSSMYLELRSLLSWNSIRSSLSYCSSSSSFMDTRRSSSPLLVGAEFQGSLPPRSLSSGPLTVSAQSLREVMKAVTNPTDQSTSTEESAQLYNTLILRLCCTYRRDCLHRKVSTAITGLELPEGLGLMTQDVTVTSGKDIFNQTVLHIAARWGASVDLFKLLIPRCNVKLLNAKNVAGETFVFALGREWLLTQPESLLEVISEATTHGLDWSLCDAKGRNLFMSLILYLGPGLSALSSEELRQRAKGLAVLLQLPRTVLMQYLTAFGPSGCRVGQEVADFLHGKAAHARDYSVMLFALDVARRYQAKTQGNKIIVLPKPPPGSHFHEQLNSLSDEAVFSVNTFRSLLYGADLGLVDGDGNTALHKAAMMGLSDTVDMLLHLCADVLAPNAAGQTSLAYALDQGALKRNRRQKRQQDGQQQDGQQDGQLDRRQDRQLDVDRDERGYSKAQKVLVRIFNAVSLRQQRPRSP
ncbi:hypothetical protein HG530_011687 [Fusarium avenaceum]|nr:hypothetical protein HG530_011687 [Fusarium avenaceum]